MTDRIDHAAEARRLLDVADSRLSANWEAETGERKADILATAQAEAVLALAEQARIANLIALLKDTFASHQALEALSNVGWAQSGQLVSLRPDIAAALGIETGADDE